MAQSVLSVRMDSDTKAAFSAFCEEVGMSISTAINIFARQTVREQRLPFEISLAANQPNQNEADMGSEKVLTLSQIKAAVSKAAANVSQIKKVILFGSYARGEARPDSDIDLRIEHDGTMGMFAMGTFVSDMQDTTGKELDIVSAEDLSGSPIADAINKDGIILYER